MSNLLYCTIPLSLIRYLEVVVPLRSSMSSLENQPRYRAGTILASLSIGEVYLTIVVLLEVCMNSIILSYYLRSSTARQDYGFFLLPFISHRRRISSTAPRFP